MMNSRSSFSMVLVAIAFVLTVCAIIVVLSAPAFGQETDSHKATVAQCQFLSKICL